ncbi:MAG: BPSS1780 family membrane protein [Luteimonas sp.]
MNDVNKVPASAGAQWLLDGFATLRKAPLGLGLLGVIYGGLSLLVGFTIDNHGVFLALQLVMLLIGPLLMGGFMFAVHNVDAGGPAMPAHLLEGFRGGRAGRLLATLLPNIIAALVCVLLLFVLVGPQAVSEMVEAMEQASAQTAPDPAMLASWPIGRLMLWLVLSFVVALTASFFTFIAIPQIMFGERGAFAAMGRSFRATVRNLSALIVFLVLALIAMFAIYMAVVIVGFAVKLVAGLVAMQVVTQLLSMAVMMPVLVGSIHAAWKQLLIAGVVAPISAGIEA